MKSWVFLIVAILSEIVGTTALKSSEGFTKLVPTIILLVAFCSALYFLSLALKTIPMGIAYAIWSGVGIVIITLVGWLLFGQKMDMPAIVGISCIVVGVIVMNVFSKTVSH